MSYFDHVPAAMLVGRDVAEVVVGVPTVVVEVVDDEDEGVVLVVVVVVIEIVLLVGVAIATQ